MDVINPFDAVSGDGATPRPLGEDLVKQALTAHMEHLRGYPWILLCGAAESSVKSSLGDALRNDQYPDSDIAWQRLQEKYQAARLLGPRDPFAAAQALEHVRKAVAIWLSPARARSLLISRGRPFLEQVASLLYDVALDRLANLQVLYMYHLGLDHVRIVQNTSPLYQLKPDRKLAEIFRRLTFEDVVNTLKPGEVFDDSYQPRPDQYAKLIYYLAYAAHMSSRREDVTQAFVVLKHALSQLPEGASIVQQPGVVAARILITHELKVVEKRLQYAGLRLVDEDADARQIRFLYTR